MIDFRDIEVKAGNHSLIFTVITGLLSLLLLFIGFSYNVNQPKSKPIEIAMNFGNTDMGQGEAEPAETEHTTSANQANEVSQKTQRTFKSTKPSQRVLSQNTTEKRVVAPTQKTKNSKPSPIPSSPNSVTKPKGDSKANNALSNILGGKGKTNSAGDGNNGISGNVGDPKGEQSDGTGIGENWKSTIPQPQTHQCAASGTIKVEIIVNAQGNIKSLTAGVRGSTSSDPCLKLRAKELVSKYVRAYPGADGRKGIYEVKLK